MRKILLLTSLLISVHTFSQQWICFHGGVTSGFQPMVNCLDFDSASDKLYVAGSFWSLDTITAYSPSIWNGTHWVMFPPAGNVVSGKANAALLAGSDYWIASTNPSIPSYRIYRINTVTYQYNIWSATADVNDLCWWNGKLVAVGNFNKMNGVTCHGIAVYDTTTQVWSPLGQGMTFGSTIDCCYNWNGKLIIGGTFGQIDGVNCNSVAMYDTTGVDHWTNLGGGISSYPWSSGQVYCFEQYNNELYVGCRANPASLLDFYKYSGTTWVNPLPTGSVITDVNCMKVYNNQLVIASFYSPGIYVFDGTNLNTSLASINSEIYAFAVYNRELIAGGTFDVNTQGDTLNYIARWSNLDIQKINAVCSDDCNGTASVQAIGPAPYHYQWNTPNNDTTQTVNNLCPGTYQVIVTDSFGLLHYGTAVITHSDSVTVNSTVTNATCAACANGSATISISHGTAPYEILWSTGDTLLSITNQVPGSYTVCVKDSNKCVVCDTVVINFNNGVNEIEPREFNITPNPTQDIINISGTKTGEHILGENLLGQVVFTTNCINEKTVMDVSGLVSGIYLLCIRNKEGEIIAVRKIIKE